uniref:Probable very-long-chain enoyl-CoA reductase art-1 (inferred by orthology to a C. elegans protein) n=1 Tax=Strongyloides venezuelensis TaxID=75913 RepID=A0A0K0EYS9_STRVS
MIKIEISKIISKRRSVFLEVDNESTIGDVRKLYSELFNIPIERIYLKSEIEGNSLEDEIKISTTFYKKLYYQDSNSQFSWKEVFLLQYGGPFIIYPLFYLRPSFIYGDNFNNLSIELPVKLALLSSIIHYGKKLYETKYIHKFSNEKIKHLHLVKKCMYHWGFSALTSYFINHPSYHPPSITQAYLGFFILILSEVGNFSIHLMHRDIHQFGIRTTTIQEPNNNPFLALFNYVSCPNYTYEICSLIGFTIMTLSFPSALFTFISFLQMCVWGRQKHRYYLEKFNNYPVNRKSVIPFLL